MLVGDVLALRQESVDCLDDDSDSTSVVWTLPLVQASEIVLPLDFDSEGGSFPLKITFDGGDSSSLIPWGSDLAFGYMEDPGFFYLHSLRMARKYQQLKLVSRFLALHSTLTLLFLKGSVSDGNLHSAVGLSLDMDKGNALRLKSGDNAKDPSLLNVKANVFYVMLLLIIQN